MKDISDVTACVCDHGLFLPLAHRLAQDYKRVLYWTPHEDGFSTIRKGIIGDGFSDIEWCDDPWRVKDGIDVFISPDIEMSGMQQELRSQGFPVWGAGFGDSLELERVKFLRTLDRLGLEVPVYRIIRGLTDLRDHLRDVEDKYIKISRWRGDMETTHWRNWKLDEVFLDSLAMRFGPAKDIMQFLVFDPIDTDIEIGADTYFVNGQWPSLMLNGTEWKDKAYFGTVTKTEEMPGQVREILEAFAPELANYGYCGQFSCEVRVKDDRAFFIDPTCRGGLPSTSSQLRLWKNISEIIWMGAHGELVEPEPTAKYSAECVLKAKAQKDGWRVVEIPEAIMPWVDISNCCWIDGRYCIPPNENQEEEIGWMVAIGSTPKETVERLGDYAAALPDGVTAEYRSLADVITEIESAEEQGVPMTDNPMPEPSTVLEEK